jgi:hypothetical protein
MTNATADRRKEPRDEDRDGEKWLARYNAEASAPIKLRLLAEREAVVRAMPSEATGAAQLAWIERERGAVLKQLGTQ